MEVNATAPADRARRLARMGRIDEPLWWSTKVGYDKPRTLFLDACPKCHQLIDSSNEPHEILNTDPRVILAPGSPTGTRRP